MPMKTLVLITYGTGSPLEAGDNATGVRHDGEAVGVCTGEITENNKNGR